MNLTMVEFACEWLAEEGYLDKMAVPARLTKNSLVTVEEAAYLYKDFS